MFKKLLYWQCKLKEILSNTPYMFSDINLLTSFFTTAFSKLSVKQVLMPTFFFLMLTTVLNSDGGVDLF